MKRRILIVGIGMLLLMASGSLVYADCQGCCSWHGGVVCRNGVTECDDGTPLSATCRNKGCNKCGVSEPDDVDDDEDSSTCFVTTLSKRGTPLSGQSARKVSLKPAAGVADIRETVSGDEEAPTIGVKDDKSLADNPDHIE